MPDTDGVGGGGGGGDVSGGETKGGEGGDEGNANDAVGDKQQNGTVDAKAPVAEEEKVEAAENKKKKAGKNGASGGRSSETAAGVAHERSPPQGHTRMSDIVTLIDFLGPRDSTRRVNELTQYRAPWSCFPPFPNKALVDKIRGKYSKRRETILPRFANSIIYSYESFRVDKNQILISSVYKPGIAHLRLHPSPSPLMILRPWSSLTQREAQPQIR